VKYGQKTSITGDTSGGFLGKLFLFDAWFLNFKLFIDRLSMIIEVVEEVAFGRMDTRLLDYLIEKSDHGKLSVTHQSIANHLGTSREVIARLLQDLEQKGKIALSRSLIQLLDL